ncbi:hypothetical protein SAMN05661086_01944 [Anaeromicropila populeti]|uniref:Uncharacterized protein n=1 Tax=Anaeromicropila populeti TaxID=37658 RepID=A0A1I6JS99_9FIRM|nr:hypothetical protein SAMN05661086_01944 [Anaeromicropila populeti]
MYYENGWPRIGLFIGLYLYLVILIDIKKWLQYYEYKSII